MPRPATILTHSVLTQIIVEQEAKSGGQTMLPVPFLRQLIRFYDDSIAKMVPSYLQMSLADAGQRAGAFPRAVRAVFAQSRSARSAVRPMQEQTRKNMAMFEHAMKMWTPFTASLGAKRAHAGNADDAWNAGWRRARRRIAAKAVMASGDMASAPRDEQRSQPTLR